MSSILVRLVSDIDETRKIGTEIARKFIEITRKEGVSLRITNLDEVSRKLTEAIVKDLNKVIDQALEKTKAAYVELKPEGLDSEQIKALIKNSEEIAEHLKKMIDIFSGKSTPEALEELKRIEPKLPPEEETQVTRLDKLAGSSTREVSELVSNIRKTADFIFGFATETWTSQLSMVLRNLSERAIGILSETLVKSLDEMVKKRRLAKAAAEDAEESKTVELEGAESSYVAAYTVGEFLRNLSPASAIALITALSIVSKGLKEFFETLETTMGKVEAGGILTQLKTGIEAMFLSFTEGLQSVTLTTREVRSLMASFRQAGYTLEKINEQVAVLNRYADFMGFTADQISRLARATLYLGTSLEEVQPKIMALERQLKQTGLSSEFVAKTIVSYTERNLQFGMSWEQVQKDVEELIKEYGALSEEISKLGANNIFRQIAIALGGPEAAYFTEKQVLDIAGPLIRQIILSAGRAAPLVAQQLGLTGLQYQYFVLGEEPPSSLEREENKVKVDITIDLTDDAKKLITARTLESRETRMTATPRTNFTKKPPIPRGGD